MEEKCEKTGTGCDWVWSDDEDASELYCLNCGRFRNWDKDEYQETRG